MEIRRSLGAGIVPDNSVQSDVAVSIVIKAAIKAAALVVAVTAAAVCWYLHIIEDMFRGGSDDDCCH